MSEFDGFRVGIGLNRLGWHPAASRAPSADLERLFTGTYWTAVARSVVRAGLAFVTVEDKVNLHQTLPIGPTPAAVPNRADELSAQLGGQLDPVVVAAVMLATSDVREVVVARNVTHTSPFQVAAQLASLAAIAPGRVTWRPQVSADFRDAVIVGGAPTPRLDPDAGYVPTRIAQRLRGLFADAEEFVRTVQRIWDVREPLGQVDVPADGPASDPRWRATGPVPVPMAVRPTIAVLAHHALEPYRLAVAVADRVFVTPTSGQSVESILAAIGQVQHLVPDATDPEVYADIAVVLGDTDTHACRRLEELDERSGHVWSTDTSIFVGTADLLAQQLVNWRNSGLAGVRLRPAVMAEDGARITGDLARLIAERSARHGE